MTPGERAMIRAIGEVAYGLALREARREHADPSGTVRYANWLQRIDGLDEAIHVFERESLVVGA